MRLDQIGALPAVAADMVADDGFRISTRQVGPDIVVVAITGDLDMATVPEATTFLRQVTAVTPCHLILDLSEVAFLASSGIGLLIAAQSGNEGIHGRLHLVGVTDNRVVQRPLAMLGLLDHFDIAPGLDVLLARLHTSQPLGD